MNGLTPIQISMGTISNKRKFDFLANTGKTTRPLGVVSTTPDYQQSTLQIKSLNGHLQWPITRLFYERSRQLGVVVQRWKQTELVHFRFFPKRFPEFTMLRNGKDGSFSPFVLKWISNSSTLLNNFWLFVIYPGIFDTKG